MSEPGAGSDLANLSTRAVDEGEHFRVRAVAPGPFFASLLAAQVAAAVGRELSGSATVAMSGEDGTWSPNEETAKHFVPSAADVDEILVVSGSASAPRIAIVAQTEVERTEVEQMDRLAELLFDD